MNKVIVAGARIVDTRDRDRLYRIFRTLRAIVLPSDCDFRGEIAVVFDLEATQLQKDAALLQLEVRLRRMFVEPVDSAPLKLVAVRAVGHYKVFGRIHREITSPGTWFAHVSLEGRHLLSTGRLQVT